MKKNIVSIRAKRAKKNLEGMSEECFKEIIEKSIREQKMEKKLLKQRLIESNIRAVNDPCLGKSLFVASHFLVFGEENKDFYIWADNLEEAEYLSTDFIGDSEDIFVFYEVVTPDGNVSIF